MPGKPFAALLICSLLSSVWAEEVAFYGHPGQIPAQNVADAAIATDGAGRWVAVWSAPSDATDSTRGSHAIFAATSFDQGHNWSNAVPVATDSAANAAQPALVFARTVWVLVWSRLAADKSGADLVASYSSDGGFSWSEPTLIAPADDGTHTAAAVAAAANGAVVAVWQSSATLGRTLGADYDILFARSTDGGSTWSDPAPLHNNAYADAGIDRSPALAADTAGNCFAAWDSTETLGEAAVGRDTDILYCVSRDYGATWSPVAHLNSNARGDDADAHVSIAAGGSGAWVAVWESADASGMGRVLYAWTSDNGRVWSNAQRLVMAQTTVPEMAPRVVGDGQGRYVAAWTRGGDIAYAHSTDAGATWSRPKPLVVSEGDSVGAVYLAKSSGKAGPLLGADAYGRWLVVWQDAGAKEAELKVTAGETVAMLPLGGGVIVAIMLLMAGTAYATRRARRSEAAA